MPHAVKWLKGENIPGVDIKEDQVRTIRVLFKYVNLEPAEINELGFDANDLARKRGGNQTPTAEEIDKAKADKEKRALLLQSAGSKLTREFREWWKQGEYQFRFSADGDYFYIWVSDDKRREEVDLSLRSTGLQWFLSFYLVFLMESQDHKERAVLLLDEAGLTLHPLAQKDLAEFFNRLSEDNQIINTTHSPFIVDPENIDRCRVVYTANDGGTVVSENLREGAGSIGDKSIYAVHAALGLTVSDVLFQGCNIVIVEGISDQFYLSAIKNVLIREGKFTPQHEILFAPSGGVRGVRGIVSLVTAKNENLPFVVLDSDESGKQCRDQLLRDLYKDCPERIIGMSDILGIEQSEIEDLIPYNLITKSVQRKLTVQDEDDDFVPIEDKPLIPQLEAYAKEHEITLENGWKVDLAKAFKKIISLTGTKKKSIPEKYMQMWINLFEKINQ